MNGPGIDDAEGALARAGEYRKICRQKGRQALGEKSLMDHSFLFAAATCYFLRIRETRRYSRLYLGIKNLCPRMEFPITPLDAERRWEKTCT